MLGILISFVYIMVLLTDEELTAEFAKNNGERDFGSQTTVHPLFEFLQQGYDASTKFKAYKKFEGKSAFPVPGIKYENVSPKIFYSHFLSQSVPLFVKEGCKHWKAFTNWKDKVYLAKNSGSFLFKPTSIEIDSEKDFGGLHDLKESDAKEARHSNMTQIMIEREQLRTHLDSN